MKTENPTAFNEHANQVEALSKLDFYADEIKIFSSRITEVAKKYTDKDVLAQVEHFQNQLIIQQNQLEDLRKEIKKHSNQLDAQVAAHPMPDKLKVEDIDGAKVATYEKIYSDFKTELNKFLSKTM